MASVSIELPSVLVALAGGESRVRVEASTLSEALRELARRHPGLRGRLLDEQGAFREHVLCFHNDVNTRWSEDADRGLAEGDRLRIMQAVSGG